MIALRVLRAGLLTTVQDLGRPRCRRWGIAPSGSADPYSSRLANALVGNPAGAALLEMTAAGGRFEAAAPIRIAAAGAAMEVSRNGASMERDIAVTLAPGEEIDFGAAQSGFRTYLAIAGGIDVPRVLGSRSTHLAAGFGGWQGRRLETGDEIPAFRAPEAAPAPRLVSRPMPGEVAELRVIAGPQRESFAGESFRRFCAAPYRVSTRSNRVGVRLEGEALAREDVEEMAPEGSLPGAIQIPPDGEPIVHLPEGPVTGGYPRIATVITADLGVLGQLRPGARVTFREVTVEDALQARREREMMFEERRT